MKTSRNNRLSAIGDQRSAIGHPPTAEIRNPKSEIRNRKASPLRAAFRLVGLGFALASLAASPLAAQDFPAEAAATPWIDDGATSAATPTFRANLGALPGNFWFGATGADRGIGYEGTFVSMGALFPFYTDLADGTWFFDGRWNISEDGYFFSNIGFGRRQYIDDIMFGVSVWHDYDGDEAEEFGHEFNQVGVSGEVVGNLASARINGYFPVGDNDFIVGSADHLFDGHYVLIRNGYDSALTGFDGEIGLPVPFLQPWAGTINVGGYHYNSEAVDAFSGVTVRLDATPHEMIDAQIQLAHDEHFGTTGFLTLAFRLGGSQRPNVGNPMLDPVQRNAHIVRANQPPIYALNPANNDEHWRAFFVDNAAAGGGDGTVDRPFDTLVEAEAAADSPFDIIFVDDGDGTPQGYNTGITLLGGQRLLGDGVRHFLPTQLGLFDFSQDLDGLTPHLSNPNGAAVTLASSTVVSGFEISNAITGILAPDPTPTVNNSDGISGDVVIDRTNIRFNNGLDPVTRILDIPMKYGINIQDSTANFLIDDVHIFSDSPQITNVTNPADVTLRGNLVAGVNIERGAPNVFFEGTIDNRIDIIHTSSDLVLPGESPALSHPTTEIRSAGGRAVRIVDTTGGDMSFNGMIDNLLGQGIMIDNADRTTATFNSMVTINQTAPPPASNSTTTEAVSIMNSEDGEFRFNNQVVITDPTNAGVLLTDNTDTLMSFFDLQVSTPRNEALLQPNTPLPLNVAPVTGLLAQRNSGGMISVFGKSYLDIVGGPALSVASFDTMETPVDLRFTRLRSEQSADGGVNLANISGNVRSTKTTIVNSTHDAILATSNDGDPLFVDFGQTTIQGPNQGPGVTLLNSPSATFSFDQLSVTTTNGAAFTAKNVGGVNFNSVPTLIADGGAALDLDNVTGTFQNSPGLIFNDLTSMNSPDEGVRLHNLTTDVSVLGNTQITGASGHSIEIVGGTGNVAFNEVDIIERLNAGVYVDGVGGRVRFVNLDIGPAGDDPAVVENFAMMRAGNGVTILNTSDAGGDVAITGGVMTGIQHDAIFVQNSNATIQNVYINGASHDAIRVETTGSSDATVLIQDNVILPAAMGPDTMDFRVFVANEFGDGGVNEEGYVEAFDANGASIDVFREVMNPAGGVERDLIRPSDVAVLANGDIVILDRGGDNVNDPSMAPGMEDEDWIGIVRLVGSQLVLVTPFTLPDDFDDPVGVTVASNGNIYVAGRAEEGTDPDLVDIAMGGNLDRQAGPDAGTIVIFDPASGMETGTRITGDFGYRLNVGASPPVIVAPPVAMEGNVGVSLFARGTGTLNASIFHNRIEMAPQESILAVVRDATATINMYAVDNHDSVGGPPNGDIVLRNDNGGTFFVPQESTAHISQDNNNATVTTSGPITFNAVQPPLPPQPPHAE